MKETEKRSFYQSASLWLVIVACFSCGIFTLRKGWHNIITWDVAGYYYYLPGLFIDHDIRLENISRQEELNAKYDFSSKLYQFHPVEGSSAHVNQYSYGMAFAFAPAFFAGHVAAGFFGYDQDGYSFPYQMSLWIWSMLWISLGLFQLRKLLLHFFSEGITSWLLITLFVGTNYAHNIPGVLAVSHAYLFTYFVLFLNATVKWHEEKTLRSWIVVCAFAGLAAIARPTEILWMIIPFLWGVQNKQDWKTRWREFFVTRKKWFYPALIVFGLLALPQLVYWKYVTGHWFFMSYSNPGEGFDFLSPHTYPFLFSARKGWFIYTPVMAVCVGAIFYLRKSAPTLAWAFLAFFLINLYVVSSWTTWWYAQCFSQRAMAQTLPLYLLALGFLWQKVRASTWSKWIYGLSALSIAIGLWFNLLFDRYVIHMDRMTPQYLSNVFYRWNATDEFDHLLLVNHNTDSLPNFEDPSEYKRLTPIVNDTSTITLTPENLFFELIKIRYRDLGHAYHYGIKIEAEIWMDTVPAFEEILLVSEVGHNGKPYGYRTKGFDADSFIPGEWNKLEFYYLTPEIRVTSDFYKAFAWYRGQKSAKIRARKVTLYEPVFQP